MYWNIKKFIILLLLNIYVISVLCQNEDETNSSHNYDILKLIKKFVKDISKYQNLKNLPEEDKHFVNAFQDLLPESVHPKLFDMLSDTASDKCVEDLKYMDENLNTTTDWLMKMRDSFGKPESGILLGNTKWLGEYDECLKAYAPPKGETGIGDFHGRYCTLHVPLKVGNMSVALSTAVCIPDSCNPNSTFNGMFNNFETNFNLTGMNQTVDSILNNSTITCKPKSKELTNGTIVVIVILSIIFLFALIGSLITAVEYYMRKRIMKDQTSDANSNKRSSLNGDIENGSNHEDLLIGTNNEVKLPAWIEKCNPFFNCFCIFTNGEKILNIASAEGQLPCLHGIRFYSMAWVIICHIYQEAFVSVRNTLEMVDVFDHWTMEIIFNGFYSVDTFFVLSAFLVGYLYFKQASKTDGKIPWLYYYIHRYIRLTPVYMLVLGFFATVKPLLISGPISADYAVIPECKDGWWWNLLYINNFKENACMPWTWYLANDMQFYAITPLILITLYRWPKIGYPLLGLFFSLTFTANFILSYKYDIVLGQINIHEYASSLPDYLDRVTDFYNNIYTKPYTRIGPYLVGLLLAYIVHKWKQNNYGQLKTKTLWVGWILGSGITLTCQFVVFHQKFSALEGCFYNSLSRIGFSLGIAWVIFVCVIGQGDIVNSILGWKALIPLSRLTYCAYLVHPIVMGLYFESIRRWIEFNTINMVMLYLATLFLAYFAALVTSLLLESPVIRLERLLRDKLSSTNN